MKNQEHFVSQGMKCFNIHFTLATTLDERIDSYFIFTYWVNEGFPFCSVVKNLPANAGSTGLIPGSGRSPGEGNGNPLQYSYLDNHMDRESQRTTVHGFSKSQTGEITNTHL